MKALAAFCALLFAAAPALAHPGHLIEAAGHDHWAAGIAIGVAVGVGIWGALRGNGAREEAEAEEAEDGEELQEA